MVSFQFYLCMSSLYICILNFEFLPHISKEIHVTAYCPYKISGPSGSKLTMSLVNIPLIFLSSNMAYMLIFFAEKKVSSFCICKSYSHFFSKNTCELDIVLTRRVNILTTNELVKLTMLWTTGPRCLIWKQYICIVIVSSFGLCSVLYACAFLILYVCLSITIDKRDIR